MKSLSMSHQQLETADDLANGWNEIAPDFMAIRQHSVIGVAAIRLWAENLPVAAHVLDLGCGFGVPLTEMLLSQGFSLYGIDASPVLLAELQQRFPQVLAKCATVEEADFQRNSFAGLKVAIEISDSATFDAVIAIGLMFLLPAQSQQLLIKKVAAVLNQGGLFLFSAPYQQCCWPDLLTGRESSSLGREVYVALCGQSGLALQSEFSDDGGNHHFSFVKQ